MNNSEQNPKSRQTELIVRAVRVVILLQAITFLFSSIMWWINDDLDKWFTRWELGMLLVSAWGIMMYLSRHYR